jgi:hypothetical protein
MPQRIQSLLLAFLPKTHVDVHEETVAEEHYQDEANVKTVTDVRKHRTRTTHIIASSPQSMFLSTTLSALHKVPPPI